MRSIFLVLLILFCTALSGQDIVKLSFKIVNEVDRKPIVGILIRDDSAKIGDLTDEQGEISFKVPKGRYQFETYFVGYTTQYFDIDLKNDTLITILLNEGIALDEVVISELKTQIRNNIESAQSGMIEIPIKEMSKLPVFLGELDILKSIQLLPGVQSGTEASTGYYVRGGGADQNLILLDGAEIYNPSHAAGFISIFNMDMIKDATLYKGGFPAKYGGRISSILDIKTKEGNFEKWETNLGVGLVTSRVTASGPIWKNKISFLGSFRSFYSYSLFRGFSGKEKRASLPKYFFYDFNGKITWRVSERDKLFVSFYSGKDNVGFSDNSTIDSAQYDIPWSNLMAVTKWNHQFKKGLLSELSFIYTTYNFNFGFKNIYSENTLKSGIKDFRIRYDFEKKIREGQSLKFGTYFSNNTFSPNITKQNFNKPLEDSTDSPPTTVNQVHLYGDYDIKINEQWSISTGLRMPVFIHPQKTYIGLEPRFLMKYQINNNVALKTSYTLMNQFVHLLSASTASTPLDLWIPSSDIVKPQKAQQVSLGYFQNFGNDKYELSVEGFYKALQNQVEYKEGANIFKDPNIDEILTFGKGWSTGAEFFIRKRVGKFNGFAGYTLGWAKRQFPELNNGRPYFAKYDRRHDMTIAINYEINKHWSFSSLFVFGTGHSITLPEGQYFVHSGQGWFGNQYGYDYGNKNSYKLRSYHRLDIGLCYKRVRKHSHSELRLDIYNVYSRLNPFFVALVQTVDPKTNKLNFKLREYSILPIVPSISFNVFFGKS
ncbi:MAG: TonB-dependent receptor plug domain-containing protein [Bacteroidetes bacterium]|nr:TonB-dependent receptor plug domain-containing protein [Bacteroidota bacterium]